MEAETFATNVASICDVDADVASICEVDATCCCRSAISRDWSIGSAATGTARSDDRGFHGCKTRETTENATLGPLSQNGLSQEVLEMTGRYPR